MFKVKFHQKCATDKILSSFDNKRKGFLEMYPNIEQKYIGFTLILGN